ncbi:threonine synthase [Vitiosangium sp. GDMCC 1.1324]|uniref:threonine synthase n=1 Tax=Vitiosangium sp. (strain GDMCC 1.1324) TaxID=2138576 RepID=UPI000D334130|nr:threonine synthase [Vitiosangium sp. GDMCC 1.1324]PTL79249.1 threonine synthase [Vitiosangium sp. GDMCC 1.1324]
MALEHITTLTCVRCGRTHGLDVAYTCPACGTEGILDVGYDYERVARTLTRESLPSRRRDQWRYMELLPVDARQELPELQVGLTPVYEAPRLAEELGLARLVLKDDGRNPTCSFKDRASAVGVVKARELGREVIACASTGNAASSLAGFSAAYGLNSVIFVPHRTPEPKVAQLLIYGARVLRVAGSYDEAYWLCHAACERYGWYNRNCAINPYLVEGKKTVGLELAEQLGARMPQWVVLSVGDGCTLAGAWKGLREMHRLGLLPWLPRMLGVQAAGSSPMVRAYASGGEPVPVEARTLADSIAVGQPRNWRKAFQAIRESQGALLEVTDEEILEAMPRMARRTAVFGEPAAAAALAGLTRAVREGIVNRSEDAVVVVTGNGLKDVRSAIQTAAPPVDLPPDLAALESVLHKLRLPASN